MLSGAWKFEWNGSSCASAEDVGDSSMEWNNPLIC